MGRVAGAIKERPAVTETQAGTVCRPLPSGAHFSTYTSTVTGWRVVPVIRYRHGPALSAPSWVCLPWYVCGLSYSQRMETTHPSPTGEPHDQEQTQPAQPDPQPAEEAARVRAGHKGRHHWAGHASGRAPWKACGEWRPMAGVECPVCPHVCPGCGSSYVTPFPVDPRDG